MRVSSVTEDYGCIIQGGSCYRSLAVEQDATYTTAGCFISGGGGAPPPPPPGGGGGPPPPPGGGGGPPPPPPTTVINPTDLEVVSFQLTNAAGTVKTSFNPGEQVYVKLRIRNNGVEWPVRGYGGAYQTELYGAFARNKSSAWSSPPGSSITSEPSFWSFDFYVNTQSNLWTNSPKEREFGSYPTHPNNSYFRNNKSFPASATPGQYTARFFFDYSDGLQETWDSTGSSGWTTTNVTNNQGSVTYTVVSNATPTPTISPDLAVTAFKLTKEDGTTPSGSSPIFYNTYPVCFFATLKNQSNTASVSPDDKTWTAFYSNGPSSGSIAQNTASDVDIYLRNGEFGAQFEKTYASNPGGLNGNFFQNITNQFGGAKCFTWPQGSTGTRYARAYMNYNNNATDSNFSNNQRVFQYTVQNAPTYTISGRVFRDINKNGQNNGGESLPGGTSFRVRVMNGTTQVAQITTSSTDLFSFPNIPGTPSQTYTVVIDSLPGGWSPAFPGNGTYVVTVGPGCLIAPSGGNGSCSGNSVINLNFGVDNTTAVGDPNQYALAGKIFYDTNGNGVFNSGEQVLTSGATANVIVSQGSTTYPTVFSSNGTSSSSNWGTNPDNLTAGTYTIQYTNPPSGYAVGTPQGGSYTLSMHAGNGTCTILPTSANRTCTPGDTTITNLDFALIPLPTSTVTPTPTDIVGPISVSGSVYVDTNENGLKDGGEVYTPPFSSPPSITIVAKPANNNPTLTPNSDGTYTFTGLIDGQYILNYTPPPGYFRTQPTAQMTFTVAANNCSEAVYSHIPGSTCAGNGNLSDVNFGIAEQGDWLLALGGDVRVDDGFTNTIPQTVAASCPKNGANQGYALAPSSSTTPGILFSGTATPNLGLGALSQTNWQIAGSTYGVSYQPLGNSLRTSYDFIHTSAIEQGTEITAMSAVCGGSLPDCTITNTIPSGVYQSDGPVNLIGFDVGTDKDIIFLVDSYLFIKTSIDVPTGSSVAFIAKQDIYVDASVGTAPPPTACQPTNGDIEGLFSADQNFVIFGLNDCTIGPDNQLNIQGSVVVNAGLGGGSFQNNRKLCTNTDYPVITIRERPDMILNLNSLLKVPTYTWQEVAP